ncbi:MAG: baseplate wedge protein 53 [Candidatus Dojkabacteria bacterium]|nr:baseplate wedge protein 53 [Candidatus Dojkabacteria bacterium]
MLVSNRDLISINSFSNLFPKTYYDKSILSQPILDIWYNYRLHVFPNIYDKDVYIYYVVQPEDNIYSISTKFYGTPELWWVILIANDILDPFSFLDLVRDDEKKVDNRKNKVIKILRDVYLSKLKRDMIFIKSINEEKNKKLLEENSNEKL